VLAVKVENIAAARPQVGLASADIVFVEEVEGSLTRLVAVYHSRFPSRVGPVRSARNTDVELLPLFGKPGLVYSGANRKVQRNIDRASIKALPRSDRDPSRGGTAQRVRRPPCRGGQGRPRTGPADRLDVRRRRPQVGGGAEGR
jgi:hypothetical protein